MYFGAELYTVTFGKTSPYMKQQAFSNGYNDNLVTKTGGKNDVLLEYLSFVHHMLSKRSMYVCANNNIGISHLFLYCLKHDDANHHSDS